MIFHGPFVYSWLPHKYNVTTCHNPQRNTCSTSRRCDCVKKSATWDKNDPHEKGARPQSAQPIAKAKRPHIKGLEPIHFLSAVVQRRVPWMSQLCASRAVSAWAWVHKTKQVASQPVQIRKECFFISFFQNILYIHIYIYYIYTCVRKSLRDLSFDQSSHVTSWDPHVDFDDP